MSACGPDGVNRQNVAKCVRGFREKRTNVHDEERIGQPSDDFIQKVEQIIYAECCMTLSEIHEKCVDVYRIVLYDVISNQLNY